MHKRIFCLVLAMMLTLGASVSALASETLTTDTQDVNTAGGEGVQATLTGTIKATNLNVTVPSNIPFTIDPTVMTGTITNGDQITQPNDIKITNDSIVPVYPYISNVTVDEHATLGDASTNLQSAEKTVCLGIYRSDSSGTAGNVTLLKTGSEQVFGFRDANSQATAVAADGGEISLKLHGAASQKGWAAGDTFTVTTTIVVAVKEPSYTNTGT